MSFKFEKLIVWKEAMDLGEEIDQLAYKLPPVELYNLRSQIRRAADSIALNIAEGSTATSNAEQARFINIAIRSCNEVACCLFKCKRRNYISSDEFDNHYRKFEQHMIRLQAFRNALPK